MIQNQWTEVNGYVQIIRLNRNERVNYFSELYATKTETSKLLEEIVRIAVGIKGKDIERAVRSMENYSCQEYQLG